MNQILLRIHYLNMRIIFILNDMCPSFRIEEDDPSLLNIAINIMNAFIKEYKSESNFIQMEGRLLT